jgi:predicted transcriptional regulator
MSDCGCTSGGKALSGEKKQVLEALEKSDVPCGNKDIAEVTGLEKKVVSSQITALKKKGLVDSPVRCKYGITEEGQAALKC